MGKNHYPQSTKWLKYSFATIDANVITQTNVGLFWSWLANFGSYTILQQVMQMLLQRNQCKIVEEGSQDFWKKRPKYKIIENTPTFFFFS